MNYIPHKSALYNLLLEREKRKFPRGQVIDLYDQRPMFHLIESGFVKRYLITDEGNKSIQAVYGPNGVFPLTPVYASVFGMDIYKGSEEYYYEAMTDLVIHSISLDSLKQAISSTPVIYKDLLYAAGVRLNSYIHRLESSSLKSATHKIANQLMYLASKFGEHKEDTIKILVPITHQTLAEMLNLARETVTRSMTALENKNLIATAGKTVTILDIQGLKSHREA